MVVDHVEQHLDAARVEAVHGAAHGERVVAGEVSPLRREEADRLVAPMVAEPLLDQEAVVHETVDGQQLDRGDTERLEVVEHGIARQRLERAGPGDVRMQRRQRLDVRLVDHRALPGGAGVARGRGRMIRHHSAGHEGRGILVVGAVKRVAPRDLALDPPGIGVEQELVRVEQVARRRRPGPVRAQAVALPRADARHVPVPDVAGALGQVDASLARSVEQAQRDARGVGGEHGEVGAAVPRRRAEGVGPAGLEGHGRGDFPSRRSPSTLS